MIARTQTVFVVMEEVDELVQIAGVFQNEQDARDCMNSSQWLELTEMYIPQAEQ